MGTAGIRMQTVSRWYLVCRDELFCPCRYVWIFRDYSNKVSQVCDAIRHLHHACPVDADVSWYVCHNQGSFPSDPRRGMSREQNQFGAWSCHVLQLLRALLQAVRGQLLLQI